MNDKPTVTTELRASIRQTFDELEQLGLIRRTGELRRGQPVFVLTELGRTVCLSPDGMPLQ